jgi:transcriptional regulator with XRE-family HTH domain
LAATQTGLSPDQIKRIETGEIAVRFFPAWNFCRFTDTNPLWLAFGDPKPRFGFIECANSTVREDALFLDVMRAFGERYNTLCFLTYAAWRASGSVFSETGAPLISPRIITHDRFAPKKGVEPLLVKPYLMPEMTAEAPPTWGELQSVLVLKTKSAEARKQLAQRLGVTQAAISQWRRGVNAPTADNALRILEWVRETEAEQKQSAGAAVTAPARTRRKSNYENDKPTDRKRK